MTGVGITPVGVIGNYLKASILFYIALFFQIVQESLDKARKGRICIIVTHRLSTIQDADQIAVIHDGKIVEYGSHLELMRLNKYYAKLNNYSSMQNQQTP